jgi:hypothetical protein
MTRPAWCATGIARLSLLSNTHHGAKPCQQGDCPQSCWFLTNPYTFSKHTLAIGNIIALRN